MHNVRKISKNNQDNYFPLHLSQFMAVVWGSPSCQLRAPGRTHPGQDTSNDRATHTQTVAV